MSVVYVPSKDRPELAVKTWNQLDKHNDEDYEIFIVVEPQDVEQYFDAGFQDDDLFVLPRNNKGIGYARRQITEVARASHFRHIIMCDDDLRVGEPFHTMVEFLESDAEVLGCGAFFSNYGLMFDRDSYDEPFPVSGSLGYNLFALNIDNLFSIGGYEDQFTNYQEDTEICRLWIKKGGVPWYVDPFTGASGMGKRFGPGGLSSLPGNRMEEQERCHQIVFDRWGERYISEPPKKFRCSWKRLLEDFAPDYVPTIYPRSVK